MWWGWKMVSYKLQRYVTRCNISRNYSVKMASYAYTHCIVLLLIDLRRLNVRSMA